MDLFEQHLKQKPKKPIYHYTSQKGLIGIFENKEIWASKIQYLNDSTEFSYACDLLNERLESKFKETSNNFKHDLKSVTEGAETGNIFAASFSEKGDLLSQWRAYCPKSGGFSIGFNYPDLEWSLETFDLNIAPCIYNFDKQIKFIDEFIESCLSEHKKEDLDNWFELLSSFRQKFVRLAPILKHPSFEKEQEWRIVSTPVNYSHKKVNYRQGESMIVPYFKIKLSKPEEQFDFHKINIGPTPHPDLSAHSVMGLLFKSGHFKNTINTNTDKVSKSDIPYRTW